MTCPNEYKQFDSCQTRCGDMGGYNQCGCHSDCRGSNKCCGDFKMVCPNEYQQFIPTQCDPEDDVPDDKAECSLCQSTDEIPDNFLKCGSCENRCGGVMETSKVKCSCDALCGFYDDCCADFEHFCPEQFQV